MDQNVVKKWVPTKRIVSKWRLREHVEYKGELCKICDQRLTDARTVSCLHSFCEQCLLQLLQTYEARGKLKRTFPCPVCNFRIPCHVIGDVADEWLDLYPKKALIDRLREAVDEVQEPCQLCLLGEHGTMATLSSSRNIEKSTPKPNTQAGENAMTTAAGFETIATCFCVDCKQYMCNGCQKDHEAQPKTKHHKSVGYTIKEMKSTPVSNISRFQCKLHASLRYTGYCTVHNVFVCNNCAQTPTHRNCHLIKNVLDATSTITKAETMMNDINSLNRDEWNRGHQLFHQLQQIVRIQTRLNNFRRQQEATYRNYVRQITITQQKCEEIDALKGKLEFVKTYMNPEIVYSTMNRVADILAEYARAFPEDDKPERAGVEKCLSDIEKTLNQNVFDTKPDDILKKTTFVVPRDDHMCKRHVDYVMDEESLLRVAELMKGVGALCHNTMASTAFRVGSSYVITTAHTVRDIVDPDRTGNPDWSALTHRDVFVSFDSRPNTGGVKYPISSQIPFMNDQLGIAVLKIYSDLPLPSPLVLSTKHVDELHVQYVTVIGHGQAGSNKKSVDFKCELIRHGSDRANMAEAWLKREERKYRCHMLVEKGEVTPVNWSYQEMKDPSTVGVDSCFGYRAMGSPIIAHLDPGRSEVMGIIVRSVPDCFPDLPAHVQDLHLEHRFELATTLNSLYDSLLLEHRYLADDIFVKDKNYFHDSDIYTDDRGSSLTSSLSTNGE